MASEIARTEAEIKEFTSQLEDVQELIRNDPNNAELQALKTELEEGIVVLEETLVSIRQAAAPQTKSVTPEPEKWSKANHPAFQPGYKRVGAPAEPVEEAPAPTELRVNDTVMAKWVTGDKAFYAARIISITGSKADPIYTVSFKSYGNSETVRSQDIRAIASESKKRKADSNASTPSTPTIPNNSNVISAAANINPDLVRKEPSKVSDGPARPAKVAKKIQASKVLEAGKNKWQDFSAKGKMGKAVKKESMFRTGEGMTARVGFVGSGTSMRKDAAKTRHVYEKGEVEAED